MHIDPGTYLTGESILLCQIVDVRCMYVSSFVKNNHSEVSSVIDLICVLISCDHTSQK